MESGASSRFTTGVVSISGATIRKEKIGSKGEGQKKKHRKKLSLSYSLKEKVNLGKKGHEEDRNK